MWNFHLIIEIASTHSTHSDDLDGGSVDTVTSRKSAEQHKQELLALEQQMSDKHQKEIQNLQTQHQARIEDMEDKYKVLSPFNWDLILEYLHNIQLHSCIQVLTFIHFFGIFTFLSLEMCKVICFHI